jgi:hypothetical protein
MQKDESQISRQARWQRKHRAMGLCVLCSRPAFKGWRCKKHYEQHKITMRLRYIPKVRGRYKVGGASATEATTKRRATKTKSAAKSVAKKATRKASTRKTTARATTAKTAARKTTARKATSRKTTARRSTAKRSARA